MSGSSIADYYNRTMPANRRSFQAPLNTGATDEEMVTSGTTPITTIAGDSAAASSQPYARFERLRSLCPASARSDLNCSLH